MIIKASFDDLNHIIEKENTFANIFESVPLPKKIFKKFLEAYFNLYIVNDIKDGERIKNLHYSLYPLIDNYVENGLYVF